MLRQISDKNGSVGYRCERHNEKRQRAWLLAIEVSGVMKARPILLRHHGVHRLLCGRFVCRLLTREDTSFDAHGVLLRIVGSRLVLTVPKTARGGVDVGELMHLHALPLNGVLEVGNNVPAVAVTPSGAVRLEHIRNAVATLLKVLNVLMIILLFSYFLQPLETDCGIVSDITSARYRLSE